MIRTTALIAATAVAVHELVYLVAQGGDIARTLSHGGHPQLAALTPAVAILMAAALVRLIVLLARARRRAGTGPPGLPLKALWLGASASLVVIFAVQVSLESVVMSGDVGGLDVSRYGSWAVLAAVIGTALVPLLRDPAAGALARWWQPGPDLGLPRGTPRGAGAPASSGGPRAASQLAIGVLGTGHLDFAAALHERTLTEGLFPLLGRRFLRLYYRSFLASPHAAALVAHSDGRPVGMLVGTLRNRAHYAWVVRRRGPRLAFAAACALARRPRVALLFARTRLARYRRAVIRHSTAPTADDTGDAQRDVAVLTHLSVAADARGAGAGRGLVGAFVAEAARTGAREAHLVTAVGDEGAGEFYAANGWHHDGDRMNNEGDPIAAYSLRMGGGAG